MSFTDINNFLNQYFGLFPIASLCIFLVFATLKMRNCAWFLSLSAPGAIVLPIAVIEVLVNPAYRRSAVGLCFYPWLSTQRGGYFRSSSQSNSETCSERDGTQ